MSMGRRTRTPRWPSPSPPFFLLFWPALLLLVPEQYAQGGPSSVVHAFQLPTPSRLPTSPARRPVTSSSRTALHSSPFDDLFLLNDPFFPRANPTPTPRRPPPPSAPTPSGLRPGTQVYIADLQGPGLVMGRESDGQYVLQIHVAGRPLPVLIRRPASSLYVRDPAGGGQVVLADSAAVSPAPPAPSASTARGGVRPQQQPQQQQQRQQGEEVEEEEGEEGASYRLFRDPRTGKTYAIYNTPSRPRPQLSPFSSSSSSPSTSRPLQNRVRLSPSRDELRDLLLSRQGMSGPLSPSSPASSPSFQQQQQQQLQQQQQQRRPLPGRDFVAQTFEDLLRASSSPSSLPSSPSKDNDQYTTLCRLAEAYSLSGPPEAAYHYLRQALELNPERFVEDSAMLSRLGEAQHRLGQVNEARKTYQKVVELQERERKRKEEKEDGGGGGREGGKVALRYGIALHDQGDPVGACGWYYRAIQLDPQSKAAFNNLGVALQETGNFAPALQAYKKALDIDGLYAPALQNLAALTVSQGRFKLALACIQRAFLLSPNDMTARRLATDLAHTHPSSLPPPFSSTTGTVQTRPCLYPACSSPLP